MDKNFSSDKPISKRKEDRFQRYDFAKRIANTILERNNKDCIVIGLYGAWGEGKTSVLNFIETELKKEENIVPIKFNPWRYSDESSLLIEFFTKLSSALNVKLKTNKELFGSLLKKYGSLMKIDIPVIGNISDTVQGVGDALGEVDIETLKERIEKILIDSNHKIVIFIDDIDRLDRNEIHSIFRLVKLTADFSNTVYILSFDEEMVASAIGERFGAGNQKSGQNFLEKIIQVPLQIPVAQPDALKEFCFELINNTLDTNKIDITEPEAQRFVNQFTTNILVRLDTPRLAVRYGNSLSFSLPLLFGEVNIVDLMLIEAIKIFYPTFYEFIKLNPDYFIGNYYQSFSNKTDEDKISQFKEDFVKTGEKLTKKQKKSIQELLEELFPQLQQIFGNIHYGSDYRNEWFKNKRIASAKYFGKYFSYAVIKGELSDVSFQNLLSEIPTWELEETHESIKEIIKESSADNFIHKLRSIEDEFDWDIFIKIVKAISYNSELLPKQEGFSFSFGYDNPSKQFAVFIYQVMKRHSDLDGKFELAKDLMINSKPFDYAYEINNMLRTGETVELKIFNTEQFNILANLLIKRAILEAGNKPIFESFPERISFIFSAWSEQDKPKMDEYIRDILDKKPEKCVTLLRAFTPTRYSTAVVGPYKSDFTKERYQYFISLFDSEYINECIDKTFSEKELIKEEVYWIDMKDNTQSDLNIIRQFKHWYQDELLTETK